MPATDDPDYHRERHHLGLDNKIIEPGSEIDRTNGNIRRREGLGGKFHYYCRDAALPPFEFLDTTGDNLLCF